MKAHIYAYHVIDCYIIHSLLHMCVNSVSWFDFIRYTCSLSLSIRSNHIHLTNSLLCERKSLAIGRSQCSWSLFARWPQLGSVHQHQTGGDLGRRWFVFTPLTPDPCTTTWFRSMRAHRILCVPPHFNTFCTPAICFRFYILFVLHVCSVVFDLFVHVCSLMYNLWMASTSTLRTTRIC